MKSIGLTLGAFLVGIVVASGDNVTYDKKPLPPGPIIERAPAMSAWQIAFTYGPPPTDGTPAPPVPVDTSSPKLLTVTRTKPQFHAVLVDGGGHQREVWYDGATRYLVNGPKSTDVLVIVGELPGYQNYLLDYVSGPDFPDMEWVSPGNYLGMQTGTNFWVFQRSPNGPMVWIDSSTHYPVQWQSGQETRTIHFLSSPTDPLVLPPNLATLALNIKHLDSLAHAQPGHL